MDSNVQGARRRFSKLTTLTTIVPSMQSADRSIDTSLGASGVHRATDTGAPSSPFRTPPAYSESGVLADPAGPPTYDEAFRTESQDEWNARINSLTVDGLTIQPSMRAGTHSQDGSHATPNHEDIDNDDTIWPLSVPSVEDTAGLSPGSSSLEIQDEMRGLAVPSYRILDHPSLLKYGSPRDAHGYDDRFFRNTRGGANDMDSREWCQNRASSTRAIPWSVLRKWWSKSVSCLMQMPTNAFESKWRNDPWCSAPVRRVQQTDLSTLSPTTGGHTAQLYGTDAYGQAASPQENMPIKIWVELQLTPIFQWQNDQTSSPSDPASCAFARSVDSETVQQVVNDAGSSDENWPLAACNPLATEMVGADVLSALPFHLELDLSPEQGLVLSLRPKFCACVECRIEQTTDMMSAEVLAGVAQNSFRRSQTRVLDRPEEEADDTAESTSELAESLA